MSKPKNNKVITDLSQLTVPTVSKDEYIKQRKKLSDMGIHIPKYEDLKGEI